MVRNKLTLQQKVEIIRLVGDNAKTYKQAAEEFNRRHQELEPVSFQTVANINSLFDRTGNVISTNKRGNNLIENRENIVLNQIRHNPKTSVRQISRNTNIPSSKVWRCLKKNKKVAYKPKFLHTLENGDENSRMEYALWCQGHYLNDHNFLNKILFSDEATFTTNGVVSSQNCRFWSEVNPHWVIHCKRQYSEKINVWCGIFDKQIIGPFFFQHNLKAQNFLNFLNTNFWDALEELPIARRADMIFQMDGAPVHTAAIINNWLDQKFPRKWIGRYSQEIKWPPRSPDLTPLDFYLWGKLKENVYRTRPNNVEELKRRITEECELISHQELAKVMNHCQRRLEKCIQVEGGVIENSKI